MKKIKKITAFDVINTTILVIVALCGILPFVHMVAVAFSSGRMSAQNLVGLWPKEFSLEAFKEALSDNSMITAVGVSLKCVVLGTVITMVLTIFTAYPVSLEAKEFPGRKFYVVFMVITMLFSGGLIPSYVLISDLKLMDKIWGWESEAEINVVWVNISQLRKKIAELNSETEIRVYRGTGYALEKKA